MIYLLIAVAVIGIIYFFYVGGRRSYVTDVTKGVLTIHVACALYIYDKYKSEYGEEKAGALGAAVTNELFGRQPSNEVGLTFLEQNKVLVDEKVREIVRDERISDIVSIAAYMHGDALFLQKERADDQAKWLLWADKLKDMGILLPKEKINQADFLRMANDFEGWVKQQSYSET